MAVNLAPGPFGAGGQFFDTNGKPLNAGLINTYSAGTTTPLATFTTSTGNVSNGTTITLGVDGRPPNEIWLTAGSSYRFDLLDSLNNLIKTYDNLSGINDITGIGEWIATNLTPVFISSTSFSLTGNQTSLLPNAMRLKTANTGGTMYGAVVSSSYASIPNTTTFVIANDPGSALDTGLSTVSYSILSPANPSVSADYVLRKASLVTSAGVTNIWGIAGDYVHVTGGTVTSITSLGTALYAGNERTIIADASFALINSAAIQCIASANITALAGDSFIVRAETTTIAKVTEYSRATGKALVETYTTLPPLTTVLTSGSGTYTPASPRYIRVELIGAGGGGGATAADGGGAGSTGGSTTFATITGTGGVGGVGSGGGISLGGTASGGDVNISGGSGQSGAQATAVNPGGGTGGQGYFGGGAGGAGGNQAGTAGAANSGGGGAGHGGNNAVGGGGGAAGGYARKTITTISASYTYSIGVGGTAATSAGAGGSGIIIIEEHYS